MGFLSLANLSIPPKAVSFFGRCRLGIRGVPRPSFPSSSFASSIHLVRKNTRQKPNIEMDYSGISCNISFPHLRHFFGINNNVFPSSPQMLKRSQVVCRDVGLSMITPVPERDGQTFVVIYGRLEILSLQTNLLFSNTVFRRYNSPPVYIKRLSFRVRLFII